MWPRVVALQLEVFVAEREEVLHVGVYLHARQWSRSACELQSSLVEMVEIEMGVASCVYEFAHCAKDEDIYIIGGASVYEQALPIVDRLCLTEIHDTPANADAFFPEYDGWKETAREEHSTDEKHHQAYAFVDYVKP